MYHKTQQLKQRQTVLPLNIEDHGSMDVFHSMDDLKIFLIISIIGTNSVLSVTRCVVLLSKGYDLMMT